MKYSTTIFKHIFLYAGLSFTLGVQHVIASELASNDSVSSVVRTDSTAKSQDIDPFEYRLQSRYLEKGKPFPSKNGQWFRNFTVGIFGGLSIHANHATANLKSSTSLLDRGDNFGALLQYDFSRLHAVRLMVSRSRFDIAAYSPFLNADEVMLGYDFNLTNYFKGYDDTRRFNASIFAGLGLNWMNNGQKKYKAGRGEVGIKFEYGILNNLSLFAEPYFSIAPDNYDHYKNPSIFEYGGGVRAGVKLRPYMWKNFYDSYTTEGNDIEHPIWYQRFFFGGSMGLYMSNTTGYFPSKKIWRDHHMYLGFRTGTMSSVRLMASTQASNEAVTKKRKVSAEFNYMLDLTSPFMGYKANQHFRIYGFAGLGMKYTDSNYGEKPTSIWQYADSRAMYLAGGLSAHYFFTPQWSIFAEPWVAKILIGKSTDRMAGVRLGGQFTMTGTHTYVNRLITDEYDMQVMHDWRKRPASHLFYGGSFGFGVFARNEYGNMEGAIPTVPVNLFAGYRFSPTQSLRLQATYLQPTEIKKLVIKEQRLMGHLDYILNFTNLVRGYKPDRHLTFSGFAGFGVQTLKLHEGRQTQTKVSPMAIAGAQVDYRLNNGISLFLEPWTSISKTKEMQEYHFGYGVNAGVSMNMENSHMYGPIMGGTRDKNWDSDPKRHFFFGAGSGYTMIRKRGVNTNNLPMMAYIGYKFTPVQSLRLRGMYQKSILNNDPTAMISGHIDYMLNLTNLFASYRPNRVFQLQNFIGLGIEPHPLKAKSFGKEMLWAATGGFNASVRIKNGFGIFVEPELAFYKDRHKPSEVNIQGTVLAGLNLDLEPIHAYHPSFGKKSKDWHPALYERFFAGISYGYLDLVNSQIGTTPITSVFLGYKVSPIHSWRMRAMFNRANIYFSPVRRLSASLDYMFNMTNMLNEYDPKRRLNFSGVLSAGLRYNERWKRVWVNKGTFVDSKLGVHLTGGLNVSYTLTPGIDVFVEPSIGVALGSLSTLQHRYTLGINGGLVASLVADKKVFGEAHRTMNHRLFYEAALGLMMPTNIESAQNMQGYSIDGRLGLWVNPVVGARLSLVAENYYYGSLLVPHASRKSDKPVGAVSTFDVLGRGEILINPINLTKSGRESANSRLWDINLAFGAEAGVAHRTSRTGYGNDKSIPYGFTVSAQLMYRTNPYTSLFIEPRYERINAGYYREPGMHLGNRADKLFTLQAGFRLQSPTREQKRAFMKQDNSVFVPHSFAGLRLGGYRGLSYIKSGNGGRIAGMLTADYGYAFTAKHALKLQLSASRFVNHGSNHRYALLDYGVLYMGNLTNMITGTRPGRKLNIYGEVGPMFTSMVGHTAKAPCNHHFAAGAAAGLMGTYKLTDKLSITAEGLGQMMGSKTILPGQVRLLNCLRVNMTAGVQYKF